jgi:hypothetical protein
MDPKPNRHRKPAFVCLMAIATLLVLEGGARIIEYVHTASVGDDLKPYAEIVNPVPVFEKSGVAGEEVHIRTRHHKWVMAELQFPAKKMSNAFRVFCLGGSAALGWPNKHDFSYPEFLSRKLEKLLPGRRIEVLNVAAKTYGSHRVKFVFDEVINYAPDLILVYCGNNEFFEQFVYVARTVPRPWRYLALARIPYSAMKTDSQNRPVVDIENYGDADRVVNMLSFAFGNASRLRENPRQLEVVLDVYRNNIESMIRECGRRNISILLLDVPVNLKDWVPNVSVHEDGVDLAAWRQAFREGIHAYERAAFTDAVTHLEHAVHIDDAHAETRYFLGRSRHSAGDAMRAKGDYVEALEEDAYPFRALPRQQAILADLAAIYDVPLVEITKALELVAEDEIIGLDVLMDYVHPTPESNEIVAHIVAEAIIEHGILPESLREHLDEVRIEVPEDATGELEIWRALYSQNLVMRQYEKLDALAERIEQIAAEIISTKPEQAQVIDRFLAKLRTTQDVAKKYRKLLQAEKFGTREQEFTHAEATKIFNDYVELIRRHEGGDVTPEEFEEFLPEAPYRNDGSNRAGG